MESCLASHILLSVYGVWCSFQGCNIGTLGKTVARSQSTVKHPNKGHFGGGPFVSCRVERLSSSDFLLNLLENSRNKHLKVFHLMVFTIMRWQQQSYLHEKSRIYNYILQ